MVTLLFHRPFQEPARGGRHAQHLVARAGAPLEAYVALAQAESARHERDRGPVRGSLHRRRAHAHDEPALARADDRVAPRARDDADRKTDARLVGAGAHTGGGRSRSSTLATIWIAMSAMNGEKSRPPIIGRALRIGPRIGSLTCPAKSPKPSRRRLPAIPR